MVLRYFLCNKWAVTVRIGVFLSFLFFLLSCFPGARASFYRSRRAYLAFVDRTQTPWTTDYSLYQGTCDGAWPVSDACRNGTVTGASSLGCQRSYDSSCGPEYLQSLHSRVDTSERCFVSMLDPVPVPTFGSFIPFEVDGRRCMDHRTRYALYEPENASEWDSLDLGQVQQKCTPASLKIPRTAIVVRAWSNRKWLQDDVNNIRALFAETTIQSRGQLSLFILLQILDPQDGIPGAGESVEDVKSRYVPEPLVNITEIWTTDDCKKAYPSVGNYDYFDEAMMPVQLFSRRHPEFDFIWNWEMDVRFTGHYGDLFRSTAEWATRQPEEDLLEQNTRFFFPPARKDSEAKLPSLPSQQPHGTLRAHQSAREADLITFYPIFDVHGTAWYNTNRLFNYGRHRPKQQYGTIGLSARFSRTLLDKMDEVNVDGRSMMSETFAPTIAAKHDLKSVFVPHPVFMDEHGTAEQLDRLFNAGPNGETNVVNLNAPFERSTWSFRNDFALDLYRRWLGLAESGPGSSAWEEEHGTMCLPPVLLHPVKSAMLLT